MSDITVLNDKHYENYENDNHYENQKNYNNDKNPLITKLNEYKPYINAGLTGAAIVFSMIKSLDNHTTLSNNK